MGTLEQLETFYRVVLHRASYQRPPHRSSSSLSSSFTLSRLNTSALRAALAAKYSKEVRANPSTHHWKGEQQQQEKEALLVLGGAQSQRCAGMLWRVAGAALAVDDACYSS